MVGGTVIEVISNIETKPDAVWVNAKDMAHGDECAIYVEKNETSLQINVGDSIWWQGGYAMWTPREVVESGIGKGDIQIPRIGFSGVSRPATQQAVARDNYSE